MDTWNYVSKYLLIHPCIYRIFHTWTRYFRIFPQKSCIRNMNLTYIPRLILLYKTMCEPILFHICVGWELHENIILPGSSRLLSPSCDLRVRVVNKQTNMANNEPCYLQKRRCKKNVWSIWNKYQSGVLYFLIVFVYYYLLFSIWQ